MNTVCCQRDAYLNGRLNAERAAEFESHLVACAECRLHLAIDRELDAKIADAWQHVSGPSCIPKLALAEKPQPINRIASPGFAVWSTVAAVVLMLGVSLPWLIRLGTSETAQHREPVVQPAQPTEPQPSAPQVIVTSKHNDLLLVPTTRSSPEFTIVKVYRPMISNYSIERNSNEPTN